MENMDWVYSFVLFFGVTDWLRLNKLEKKNETLLLAAAPPFLSLTRKVD